MLSYEEEKKAHWKRFIDKYDLRAVNVFREGMQRVRNRLRRSASLRRPRLLRVLQRHLRERLNTAVEQVEFVMRDGLHVKSMERTLKVIQFFESGRRCGPADFEHRLAEFQPKFRTRNFQRWKQEVRALRKSTDKYELFNRFAEIESEFSELERQIDRAAMAVDQEIQHQIDVLRGK
jgi:hypothetical protein